VVGEGEVSCTRHNVCVCVGGGGGRGAGGVGGRQSREAKNVLATAARDNRQPEPRTPQSSGDTQHT
jgi:hypothetical protein